MKRVLPLWLFGGLALFLCSCNLQRGALQGEFLGSGFDRPHSSGILSVLWRRHIDPNYGNKVLTWKLSPQEHSAPTVDTELGQVCVGSERQFFSCFELKTGRIKWSIKTQGRVASQAVIHGDMIYVGTTSGVLMAYNRSNGKPAWKKPYQSDGEILAKPTVATVPKSPPLIIFSASNNKVYALNALDGKWVWLYRRDPPDQLSIRGQAPPLFHKETIYTGFSDGTVAAIQASDGTKMWEQSIKEKDRFADVDAPLAVDDSRVFASSYNGSFYALSQKDGKILWKQTITGATNPVLSDGYVFVATSDGRVAKYSAESGKPLWKQPLKFRKASSFNSILADDYYLYASSTEQGIYVIQRDKGSLVQILKFGSGFAPLTRSGSQLFALSYASFLYHFSAKQNVSVQR